MPLKDGKKLWTAWMPLPDAPEEFLARAFGAKDHETFAAVLTEGVGNNWVEVLGVTDKDPKDIKAVLSEHYNVHHVAARET